MKTKLGGALAAASLLASALITLAPIGPVATAATSGPVVIVVDVTADTPGTCSLTGATSTCSLRSAVALANAQRNVSVTIQLAAGTYPLTTPLTITGAQIIRGAGQPFGAPGATVIDAQAHQGIVIDADNVTLQGVSVINAANTTGAGAIQVNRNRKNFLLLESSVYQSSGLEGGGLYIDTNATATVQRSTFANNTAKNKGGAIRAMGKVEIVNSTFTGNIAQSGGAVSVAGAAAVSFSTFIDNTSNSEKGAGVDRNGGTVYVTGSILTRSNQQSASGSDCSGNPDLIGPNFVGNAQGCNPDASVLVGTTVGALNLGPLTANGGPTATIALSPGSVAIDKASEATCKRIELTKTFGAAITADQRNVARPQSTACDLGAYEYQALAVGLTLTTDTATPYVGTDDLPSESIGPAVIATDQLFGQSLAASPLSKFPLESVPLNAFPLSAFPLNAFPLNAFPLNAFFTAASPLSKFPLSKFPLSAFPLNAFPLSDLVLVDGNTWEQLLAGSGFEQIPLQSLTLDDVSSVPAVRALSLGQMNLEGTPLSAFPLSAFLLGSVPLNAFPLSAFGTGVTDWCQTDAFRQFCADGDLDPADPNLTLASAALAGVPLNAFPLSKFPLNAFPLSKFPLNAFPLNAFPLSKFNLAASPLSKFPLSAFGPTLPSFMSCGGTCTTLGQVTFAPNATFDTLATALLAMCPAGSITAEACVPAGFTLADLIAGLVPPSSVPWEQVDLEVPGLQNAGDPAEWTFRYLADISLTAPATSATLTLSLPRGFAYAPGGTTLDGAAVADPTLTCADTSSVDCVGGRTVATFRLSNVAGGTHRLSIPSRAGFVLQQATADATVVASNGAAPVSASASTIVTVQAPAARRVAIKASGSSCSGSSYDGDVQLGWTPSSTTGVHIYSFVVSQADAACGMRADAFLSNLPVDFDLVMYGAKSAPLRGVPTESIAYLDDVQLDLNPFDDIIQADTVQDIPQQLPADVANPNDYAVVAISSNRDQGDERIRTGTLRAGTYYLQVSAYNGASSNLPYALRLRTDSTVGRPTCAAQPAPTAAPGVLPTAVASDVNTLFLVNQQLLEREYGPDRRAAVMSSITALAGRRDLGVVGAVIPVDANPAVRAAYATRFADPCNPETSNDVVRAIGSLVDTYTASTIQNIVIVGDDRQIPMANIVDDANFANERAFGQEFTGAENESSAALDAGMYRSDDPYGTAAGIRIRDHELFVPERAVGRLVETPEQITAAVANYASFGGRLDPDATKNAFETGYEFLEDGAQANADNLTARGFETTTLLGDTWKDEDLVAGLSTRHDVVGINAHFDQNNALPAYDNFNPPVDADELFDSSELPAAVDRTVVYSMGCHSGYSLSDVQVGVPAPDWAQALAGQRANTFIGNTGFGYGDTDKVALTEELTAIFADEVGQGGSIGQAWVDAKQRMVGEMLVLDAYQEKAVQQFVFYGLPMFHLGEVPPNLSVSAEAAPGLGAAPIEAPAALVTDSRTGLKVQPVDVVGALPTTGSVPADVRRFHLNTATNGAGKYYDLDGSTLDVNGHPIQPLYTDPLPAAPGLLARDALVTELTSQNVSADFDPVFFWASPNFGGPRPEHFDGSFPAEMATVRTFRNNGVKQQQVLLAAGQYRASDTAPDVGAQRLHTHVGAQVYYVPSANTDFTAPLISRSLGFVDGRNVRFDVTSDATAQRVYVLYRNDQEQAWHGLDLSRDGAGWSGVGPFTATGGSTAAEFIVQAVDGNGNVAMSNQKSRYFMAANPGTVSNLVLTASGPKLVADGDWFTGDVTVTADNDGIDNGVDAGIRYRLDGGAFAPYASPFTVMGSATGTHIANAIDTTGAFAASVVKIDAQAPVAGVSVPAGYSAGPVTVTLTGDDGVGSGIQTILYTLDGSTPTAGAAGTSTYSAASPPTVSTEGVTVKAIAVDVAGNTSAVASAAVPIDRTAPTAVVDVVDTADGVDDDVVGHGSVVTATFGCADTASGVASCVVTVDGTAVVGAGPITLPTTVLGLHVVTVTATDNVGLTKVTTASYTVADRAPPTATVSVNSVRVALGGSVTATFACADTLSPISSCVLKVDDTTVTTTTGTSSTFTIPAGARGNHSVTVTATDAAGNTFTTPAATFTSYDATAPVVSLSVTPAITTINGVVTATYSCVDPESPILSCTITVKDQTGAVVLTSNSSGSSSSVALPTSTSGSYTVVVVGTNGDGASATSAGTVTYAVGLCVIENYDATQAKTIGTNYTIKIQICDGAGKIISSNRLVLTATAIVGPDGTRYTPGANDSGSANGNGYQFRYAAKDGYIYNLSTTGFSGVPAATGTLYKLEFEAREGTKLVGIGRAGFTLKP